jgi:hypothetical protein
VTAPAPGTRLVGGSASALLGIGFGVPCAVGIAHFIRTGGVWRFLGFPTYGGGPFEQVGLRTSVPLLAAFLAVCLAETALAGLIWTDHPAATRTSHAILPLEFAFWVGFALPVGPPLGMARTVLVVLAARRHPERRRRLASRPERFS